MGSWKELYQAHLGCHHANLRVIKKRSGERLFPEECVAWSVVLRKE